MAVTAQTPVVIALNRVGEAVAQQVAQALGAPLHGRQDREAIGVLEVVVGSTVDAGRKRYGFYRDRGFPLEYHQVDDWEAA